MSLGREAAETNLSRLATARYDRKAAEGTKSENHGQSASAFGLASLLRVPVGYEDETGFHCGEPQNPEIPFDNGSDSIRTNIYRF
jgi:hypothetical protein